MFYVSLKRSNGTEILGNGSGQGFYNYKQLWRVKKIIMEYHYKKHNKYYNDNCLSWYIYSISESEKFKDFEAYKSPIAIISEAVTA